MSEQRSGKNWLIWALLAALASQMVVNPVMCRRLEGFGEEKTYYPPGSHKHGGSHRKPSCPTPSTPSHGGGGSYGTPTPSHGGGGYYSPPGGVSPPTTPVVEPGTPTTPSHGGGYYSPPSGGISPPTTPVVDPGIPTTPSHGGGGYYSPPSGGISPPTTPVVDPGTPTTPSHGGGGYYSPPSGGISPPGYYSPPSGGISPPTTPVVDPGTPTTPSHGGGGYYSPPSGVPPPSPVYEPGTPTPTTPLVPPTPYTPGISTPPSPLFPIDPNVPPFTGTCNYWRTHPQVIWGLFGYWGTLGGLLGGVGAPAANLNLLEALRNSRTDGIGALYREGTASFLNSMVNQRFVFNTQQVRGAFVAALASEQAAANQAQIFQRANEGRLRH